MAKTTKVYEQMPQKGYDNLQNNVQSCAADYFEQMYIEHLSPEKRHGDYCYISL